MKIVYLADIDIKYNKGVVNKMVNQVQHWTDRGHSAELVLIACEEEPGITQIPVKNIYRQVTFFPKKGLNIYFSKILSVKKIKDYLRQQRPDLVYFRCTMWIPGLEQIFREHTSVMEINSKDLEEIKSWKPLNRKLYLYGRKKILGNIKGIVSVSKELAQEFTALGIPVTVIANGITLDAAPSQKPVNGRISLVFVGSVEQYWQGVEKVYQLAEQLPEFDFHIVGEKTPLKKLPNVFSHGYLSGKALSDLYSRMHIGIGTLALHRKNMEEASPLKVREYVYHGLPVILGYDDTDLSEGEQILRIGNSENNVSGSVEKIKAFVLRQAGAVLTEETRAKVSNSTKEEKRLRFFEQIVREGKR